MVRILIIGSTGMLGASLFENLKKRYNVKGFSTSSKPNNINLIKIHNCEYIIKKHKPEIIINCTGLVSLDKCQMNLDKAFNNSLNSLMESDSVPTVIG